jgi:GGDEF domain-containing protein
MIELVFATGQLAVSRDCTDSLAGYFAALTDHSLATDLLPARRRIQAELIYPYRLEESVGRYSDSSTPFMSRYGFVMSIEREFARARRHSNKLTLMVIDVHRSSMLELSPLLEYPRLARIDFAARYNADALAVVLVGDEEGRATRLTDALVSADVRGSIAVGIAELDATVADVDEFIEIAERRALSARENRPRTSGR